MRWMCLIVLVLVAAVEAGVVRVDPTPELEKLPPLAVDIQSEPYRSPFDQAPPSDEAPIEVLEQYWYHSISHDRNRPSARVVERLLAHAEVETRRLDDVLKYLGGTPEQVRRVRAVREADRAVPTQRRMDVDGGPGTWEANVDAWLAERDRSAAWLEEKARGVVGKWHGVDGRGHLEAFASAHWDRALPLLRKLAADPAHTVRALALRLLFEHGAKLDAAEQARVSAALRTLAGTRTTKWDLKPETVWRPGEVPEAARRDAIRALLARPWDGRDAWYLGLFADPSVLGGVDGFGGGYDPERREVIQPSDGVPDALCGPILAEPDRTLPLVASLLRGADPTARKTALWCLAASLAIKPDARVVALLEPFLTPAPILDVAREVQDAVRALQGKAASDDLLKRLATPCPTGAACDARNALAKLVERRDARAAPIALKLLEAPDAAPGWLVSGLLQLEALPPEKLAACFVQEAGGPAAPGLPPLVVSKIVKQFDGAFGARTYETPYWGRHPEQLEDLLYTLHRRDGTKGGLRDAVAARLIGQLPTLPDAVAEKVRARVRAWPCASVDDLLMTRLAEGTASVDELVRLVARRYALRRTHRVALGRLADAGGEAWVRGFATALLVERARDVLLEEEALRTCRAVRRLASEPLDVSPAAAWPAAGWPVAGALPGWKRAFVDGLRARMQARGGPDELIALADGVRARWIVEVRGAVATITVESEGHLPRTRSLTDAELDALRAYIADNGVDGLPAPAWRKSIGEDYLYVHLVGGAGYALEIPYAHMSGCGTFLDRPHDVYDRLVHTITRLASDAVAPPRTDRAGRPVETIYQASGVEGLFRGPTLHAVWASGADVRLLEAEFGARAGDWRALAGGKLGDVRPQPDAVPFLGRRRAFFRSDPLPGNQEWFVRHAWSSDGAEGARWAGLWRQRTGREPERFLGDDFRDFVVSPDGRRVAAVERRTSTLALFDAESGRRLAAPAAEIGDLKAFTEAGLVIYADGGLHLLDPRTGQRAKVPGAPEPWTERRWRTWQPAGSGQVWVAIPSKTETRVGRLDLRTLAFRETNTFPAVHFDSMNMWVDEAAGAVFAIEHTAVLRMRLKADQAGARTKDGVGARVGGR